MKKISQKEFDDLPMVSGIKFCPPNTDYTDISSFGKGCSFGEGSSFGKGCIAVSPFWSFVYEPPFKTEGKILPPVSCKKYWEERLGFELKGCYKEIHQQIFPLLPDLIRKDIWSKCERRILESWCENLEVKEKGNEKD